MRIRVQSLCFLAALGLSGAAVAQDFDAVAERVLPAPSEMVWQALDWQPTLWDAVSPSGRLLASVNTTDPKRMAAMLDLAWQRWEGLGEGERYLDPAPAGDGFRKQRGERGYPKDGLVLRSFSRDLPKKGQRVEYRSCVVSQG